MKKARVKGIIRKRMADRRGFNIEGRKDICTK